jgi:hypothetical protein
LPIIPSRSNATKKAYCPKRFYRRRHKIENFFCRIKDWRRIATHYDKLARNFLAGRNAIENSAAADAEAIQLALQLRSPFYVGSAGFGLMCASPDGPCDDVGGPDASLRKTNSDAPDFLN